MRTGQTGWNHSHPSSWWRCRGFECQSQASLSCLLPAVRAPRDPARHPFGVRVDLNQCGVFAPSEAVSAYGVGSPVVNPCEALPLPQPPEPGTPVLVPPSLHPCSLAVAWAPVAACPCSARWVCCEVCKVGDGLGCPGAEHRVVPQTNKQTSRPR